MQAVEEVPSSSASSVAPSATTTSAAAKTAASIQEFNDEQEPGWIFGVMGGSVASVTTGTDNLRLRRQQRLFKNSMMSRNQDGSSA